MPSRRWWKWFLVFMLLSLAISALSMVVNRYRETKEHLAFLQQSIDELDASDPTWREAGLYAPRPQLPEEQSAWRCGMKALAQIDPDRVQNNEKLFRNFPTIPEPTSQPMNYLLTLEEASKLHTALESFQNGLQIALQLPEKQVDAYPIEVTPNWLDTRLPHVDMMQSVSRLLRYETLAASQSNQVDRAYQAIESNLVLGQIGRKDQALVSSMYDMHVIGRACEDLQRLLALSEPKNNLDRFQDTLMKLELDQLTFDGIRGERAASFHMIQAMKEDRFDFKSNRSNLAVLNDLDWWMYKPRLSRDQANILKYLTELMEISQLPYIEAVAEYRDLLERIKILRPIAFKEGLLFTFLIIPAGDKVFQAELRYQAQLHTTIIGLALERYRLQHGHYPDELEDLVEDFLEFVPLDPFTDVDFLYNKRTDGVEVKSVGPDLVDDLTRTFQPNEKLFNNTDPTKPNDIVFRLYYPTLRRLTPVPKEQDNMD